VNVRTAGSGSVRTFSPQHKAGKSGTRCSAPIRRANGVGVFQLDPVSALADDIEETRRPRGNDDESFPLAEFIEVGSKSMDCGESIL